MFKNISMNVQYIPYVNVQELYIKAAQNWVHDLLCPVTSFECIYQCERSLGHLCLTAHSIFYNNVFNTCAIIIFVFSSYDIICVLFLYIISKSKYLIIGVHSLTVV